MILGAAPFVLWSLLLGGVWLGWQTLDLTISMIFVSFGAVAYLLLVFIAGGSALWAVRHARSLVLPLHPSSRRLVAGTVLLLVFPWVALSMHFLVGVLRAW
jgi:hypothetical protein